MAQYQNTQDRLRGLCDRIVADLQESFGEPTGSAQHHINIFPRFEDPDFYLRISVGNHHIDLQAYFEALDDPPQFYRDVITPAIQKLVFVKWANFQSPARM
jgi:hypothetical protein